jgi:DNA-directed RNA polymerase subunit RPC12/RpoP
MSVSKQLKNEAALLRVLGSGSEMPKALQRQTCQRCGKAWWPRQSTKPARCPSCKSPYWDKPRRMKSAVAPLKEGVTKETVARVLAQGLVKAFRTDARDDKETDDRSLAKALTVLKEMKAAGKTWQEMGERMEREFGTRLDKDQLKALVR